MEIIAHAVVKEIVSQTFTIVLPEDFTDNSAHIQIGLYDVGNPDIPYPISKEYKLKYKKTDDQKFYVGTLLVKASLPSAT